MKWKFARKILFAAALCAVTAPLSPATAQGPDGPLTNASVVKLVRAGFREKTVIAIIRSRAARFDLSPERLIELKKSGVSERVILAMIAHQSDLAVAADDWGSDDDGPLFRSGGGAADPRGRKSDPGEVNIFGNSGGSRDSVRSRGLGGGSEGETQTTGSATVRILRPPAEAGGAAGAPKLEKTPTLTNESVVELVEAGFTEGTIIRRIEQSPADFNLSPEKLAELRRRRVSEPVIAAMRAAMSDDGETPRPEN